MNKKKENKRIHIDLLNTNQKTPQKEKKTEKNGDELLNPGRLGSSSPLVPPVVLLLDDTNILPHGSVMYLLIQDCT